MIDKAHASFMRSLCMGEIEEEIVFPFPEPSAAEAETLHAVFGTIASMLGPRAKEFAAWDRAGEMPKAFIEELKAAGAAIAADLGQQYEVRLPKAAAITAFQQVTSPVRAVFGVFALLALTITGLLIYSLVSVAVEERIREYAILRTLGARRRDVFRLVLSESFLLCFIGVAPGVLAGAAAAVELAASLAKFPQGCMRNDRLSAYEQWDRTRDEALVNETRRGLDVIFSGETRDGAERFAPDRGQRHGQIPQMLRSRRHIRIESLVQQ